MSISLIVVAAFILGASLVVIFVRKPPLRWRCAALAGIAALWLWGMALTLWNFLSYCHLIKTAGTGDPAAVSEKVGDFLISASVTHTAVSPLLIASAVSLFIHQPQVMGRNA